MKETVLVTGGAGLIGSHIVDELLERGYRVKVIDNLEPEVHLKGKPNWVPPDVEFIEGDVCDKKVWEHGLTGTDVVFHEAAYGGFSPEISKIARVNAFGTTLLYEVIKERKLDLKKIIVASSQAVYGEGKYRCPVDGVQHPPLRTREQLERGEWEVHCPVCGKSMEPLGVSEDMLPQTTGAYSVSKYYQERLVLGLGQEFGIPGVALRYALTFGPRQSIYNPYSGICSIFSTRILNGKPPIIYEDGNQTRDFTYVKNTAEANIFVMEHDTANNQVFNVGTGKGTRVRDFAEKLAASYAVDTKPVMPGRFRPLDLRHLVTDTSRLESIGFTPRHSLEEGIAAYVQWIKSFGQPKEYFEQAEQFLQKMGVVHSVK
jgi:dTDP-L-rhamnose 4-epimerase